jgi:tetratricopeptide (TPR) repeat protein
MRDELPHEDWTQARLAYGTVVCSAVPVCVHRGRLDEARRMVDAVAEFERSADVQERCYYGVATANLLLAQGDRADALQVAESVFAERDSMGIAHDPVKESFALAVQAALALDRVDTADELLAIVERLPPGMRVQFLDAHVARFRAHLAAKEGQDEEAERLFKGAGGLLHELAVPFHLAVTRLEHAEWFAAQGRIEEAQPLVLEAREIFERLEATPWLDRLGTVDTSPPTETPSRHIRREAHTRV